MQTAWLIVLVASATAAVVAAGDPWWHDAVLYQIYPRSFFDTRNNGTGDLKGIEQKVDYLKDLGVTGIWMNPIYPSPLKDFGYDISNFTDIDPTYGTIDDLKSLIKKIHDSKMKILMDLVPNHSSDQHPWFIQSQNGTKPFDEYYVWQDNLPNNWLSVMGGSAWTLCETNNKYYYHAFLKEQPDLNYRNEEVVTAMKDVMTFWLDLGVDGFRVDAVPYLIESNDTSKNEDSIPGCTPVNTWGCLNHTLTASQPETFSILSIFKEHIYNYTAAHGGDERIMVTEATYPPAQLLNYFSYNNSDTSTMPFNFQLLSMNGNQSAVDLMNMIGDVYKYLPNGYWTNWLLGNHDQNRIATKIGRGLGDAANMLNLLLPGTTFTYYGEELVMEDTPIKCDEIVDTSAIRQGGDNCAVKEALTRDPERTPMQWDNSPFSGFSGAKPWLPVNPDYYAVNVKSQNDLKVSHIKFYKSLVQLKQQMQNHTTMDQKTPTDWVYTFRRHTTDLSDGYIVLINLNNEQESLNLKSTYPENTDSKYVMAATTNSARSPGDTVDWTGNNITLRPYEGIVLYKTPPSASARTSVSILLLFSMIFILLRS